MKRLRRPSPAMIVALVALVVALGGTGYAAFKLPKGSVGSKQIKKNAVNSSKVRDGSLLAGDFKAGQLPAGAPALQGLQGIQGVKGDKGDACLASDPACKGPKGDTGSRGPGTLTFDGQVPVDNANHTIADVNGMSAVIACSPNGSFQLSVFVDLFNASFHGWGLGWTGSTFQHVVAMNGNLSLSGQNAGDLDVVARAFSTDPRYTAFRLNAIVATSCNYHALIIPPS
jgi:hypothetical protein